MPHKTKRQKLAAQMRREKAVVTPSEKPEQTAEDSSVTVFKHDFKKSVIVIAFITALEIITYFGTMYYHSR
jgi:hypothetical protein